jgi:hypothetical protein
MLELTIMLTYAPDKVASGYFCRTYYSFGESGEYEKDTEKGKPGWLVRKGSGSDGLTLSTSVGHNGIRCVRDASVDELRAEGLL